MKILALTLTVIFLILGPLTYLYFKYPTTSPINSATYIIENIKHPHAKMQKEVIGFLPYWRLDDIKFIRQDLVSEIIFFSLTADENGEFVKVVKNETEPGWRWYNSKSVKNLIAKTQISGDKFSLTIAMQKNKTLEQFLNNQNAQTNLINNLLKEVKAKKLDGLNIDFEYAGEPDPGLKNKFTDFARQLSAAFRKNSPKTQLSIDFFPLSVREPRMTDVPQLTPLFDKIIVMSYDYYSTNSQIAGPVAPISGYSQDKYLFDVKTTYEDYLKVVPKEKIIMGVPYYGWDWAVENGQIPLSKTVEADGFPAVLSYGRMRTNTDLKPENCQFDQLAQEKWCYYTDGDNVDHQAWFEDNQSIEAKFDFAKRNDLAGIAIWTLGYDKDYPDLWDMILAKFTSI